MGKTEFLTIKVEGHTASGIDLLPDVLRQLQAMVRLLTEIAKDPRHSKVEVSEISKSSPLTARLRLVTFQESKKGLVRARPAASPMPRLEKAMNSLRPDSRARTTDPLALTALKEFAQNLKNDVATIETEKSRFEVSAAIIGAINDAIGPILKSEGSMIGLLEGLNIHSKPWQFTIYPQIGPPRIRCTFTESIWPDIRDAIGKVVRVHGMKEFAGGSKWPLRMVADSIQIKENAPEGAWVELAKSLAKLWAEADEDERQRVLTERFV